MKQWYEEMFENYAETYDREAYTKGTLQEVGFIEQEIGRNKALRILDVGCGTGRHAIELAKRGYRVTAIDLSATQLLRAREKALQEHAPVEFVQADARAFHFPQRFDVVIMLCEGAFPLMETDEMNFQILENIAQAMNAKGKLIFTTLNALFPLHHSLDEFMAANSTDAKNFSHRFDLLTFRDHSFIEIVDDRGVKKSIRGNERYYAPAEIVWLLRSLRFGKVEIFGCATGDFRRDRPLATEDFEMLVIAER